MPGLKFQLRRTGKTRKEALDRGFTTYMGKQCKNSHSGLRYTIGQVCVQCDKDRRNKFDKSSKAICIDHMRDEIEPDYWDTLL